MSRYGKMRASFDSDGSLGPSPPMSPPRHGHPVYFVQSPSRDSTHDMDSLSQSFSRATPRESPLASPMHKHFKHSSDSASFNMTATPKPGSRRVLPQPSYGGVAAYPNQKKGYRPWAPGTILEEEEGIEGDKKKVLSRCCIVWLAVLFSLVLFFFGALIFWLVTMPHSPHVAIQSVTFQYFDLEDGQDNSGVPTSIVTLNATVTLELFNPSHFFGYHVTPSPVNFAYLDLTMAGGQAGPFYLEKRRLEKLEVNIAADRQFLHGAGPSFNQIYQAGGGVPLKLYGSVNSRARVMSKMIKRRFSSGFDCMFLFDTNGADHWKVQQLACVYP